MSAMQESLESVVSGARRTGRRVAVFAAVLGALSGLALPAHAADSVQTTVEFSDLDLSQERDINQLYARLQRASSQVCQKHNGREQYQRRLFKECYVETLERAVTSINAVQLTKLHAARDPMVAQRSRAS